jgi:hypothetical protein
VVYGANHCAGQLGNLGPPWPLVPVKAYEIQSTDPYVQQIHMFTWSTCCEYILKNMKEEPSQMEGSG